MSFIAMVACFYGQTAGIAIENTMWACVQGKHMHKEARPDWLACSPHLSDEACVE